MANMQIAAETGKTTRYSRLLTRQWALLTGVDLEWLEQPDTLTELPRRDSNLQPADKQPGRAWPSLAPVFPLQRRLAVAA